MVDGGCTVLDVTVEHPVYGEITARCSSPAAAMWTSLCEKCWIMPPSPEPIDRWYHAHRLSVPDEDAFQQGVRCCGKKGLLLED